MQNLSWTFFCPSLKAIWCGGKFVHDFWPKKKKSLYMTRGILCMYDKLTMNVDAGNDQW